MPLRWNQTSSNNNPKYLDTLQKLEEAMSNILNPNLTIDGGSTGFSDKYDIDVSAFATYFSRITSDTPLVKIQVKDSHNFESANGTNLPGDLDIIGLNSANSSNNLSFKIILDRTGEEIIIPRNQITHKLSADGNSIEFFLSDSAIATASTAVMLGGGRFEAFIEIQSTTPNTRFENVEFSFDIGQAGCAAWNSLSKQGYTWPNSNHPLNSFQRSSHNGVDPQVINVGNTKVLVPYNPSNIVDQQYYLKLVDAVKKGTVSNLMKEIYQDSEGTALPTYAIDLMSKAGFEFVPEIGFIGISNSKIPSFISQANIPHFSGVYDFIQKKGLGNYEDSPYARGKIADLISALEINFGEERTSELLGFENLFSAKVELGLIEKPIEEQAPSENNIVSEIVDIGAIEISENTNNVEQTIQETQPVQNNSVSTQNENVSMPAENSSLAFLLSKINNTSVEPVSDIKQVEIPAEEEIIVVENQEAKEEVSSNEAIATESNSGLFNFGNWNEQPKSLDEKVGSEIQIEEQNIEIVEANSSENNEDIIQPKKQEPDMENSIAREISDLFSKSNLSFSEKIAKLSALTQKLTGNLNNNQIVKEADSTNNTLEAEVEQEPLLSGAEDVSYASNSTKQSEEQEKSLLDNKISEETNEGIIIIDIADKSESNSIKSIQREPSFEEVIQNKADEANDKNYETIEVVQTVTEVKEEDQENIESTEVSSSYAGLAMMPLELPSNLNFVEDKTSAENVATIEKTSDIVMPELVPAINEPSTPTYSFNSFLSFLGSSSNYSAPANDFYQQPAEPIVNFANNSFSNIGASWQNNLLSNSNQTSQTQNTQNQISLPVEEIEETNYSIGFDNFDFYNDDNSSQNMAPANNVTNSSLGSGCSLRYEEGIDTPVGQELWGGAIRTNGGYIDQAFWDSELRNTDSQGNEIGNVLVIREMRDICGDLACPDAATVANVLNQLGLGGCFEIS